MSNYIYMAGHIDITPPLDMSDGAFGSRLVHFLDQRHVKLDIDAIPGYDPDYKEHLLIGDELGEDGWNYLHSFTRDGKGEVDSELPVSDFNTPALIDKVSGMWSDYYVDAAQRLVGGEGALHEMGSWLSAICAILEAAGHQANGTIVEYNGFPDETISYIVEGNVVKAADGDALGAFGDVDFFDDSTAYVIDTGVATVRELAK